MAKLDFKKIKADPLPLKALKENYSTIILREDDFMDVLTNKKMTPTTGSFFYDEQKHYFFVGNSCFVHYIGINVSGINGGPD